MGDDEHIKKLRRRNTEGKTPHPYRPRFPPIERRTSLPPQEGQSGPGHLDPEDFMLIPDGYVLRGAHEVRSRPELMFKWVTIPGSRSVHIDSDFSLTVHDATDVRIDRIDLGAFGLAPIGLAVDGHGVRVELLGGIAIGFRWDRA